jgi:hypothetical protein
MDPVPVFLIINVLPDISTAVGNVTSKVPLHSI